MKRFGIPKWSERSVIDKVTIIIYCVIIVLLLIDCILPNISYARYIGIRSYNNDAY